MDRQGVEQELRALTRRQLLILASEAGIVGRHKMKKDALVELLVLPRIYQALPESTEILHGLVRSELLRLCEMAGEKVRKSSRKADLIGQLEKRVSSMQGKRAAKRVPSATPRPEARDDSFPRNGLGVDGHLEELSGPPEPSAASRVVLLPVDPYLVHVYWEVAPSEIQELEVRFRRGRYRPEPVLRFFDVSKPLPDGASEHGSFDVEVELEAGQWYVHLWSPQKSYYVELGLRARRGRFVPLCRSRVVDTPPAWPSSEEGDRYLRLDDDGQLFEAEVTEANPPGDSQVAKGAQVLTEVSLEERGISDAGEGTQRAASEGGTPTVSRQELHSTNAARVNAAASGPDLTELCERIADLGASSGSRLCVRQDGMSAL